MKNISLKSIQKIIPKTQKLKILFIGSEASPFAKAGGMGDVLYSLPLALNKLGHDARIMIPRYGTINPKEYNLANEARGIKVPTDQQGSYPFLICNVKKYESKDKPTTYFLENMEYYEKRANVYGYSDDHIRWALFCRGTIEFLRQSSWMPDIIVASDWQTGLFANYLRTKYNDLKMFSGIPVIFAIHNLQYQGMCDFKYLQESEKDSGREKVPDFFNPRIAKLNWMLRGILYSDSIVTVSPTYAKEILTPEYGEGLDKILIEKQHKLSGILNGIGGKNYNPKIYKNIPFACSLKNIEAKKKNKAEIQKRFGLEINPNAFLIGMVSRLSEQKGFDILGNIIDPLLANLPSLQLIFIGDGESRYKELIQRAAEKFPKKIGCHLQFDTALPNLIFAGADAVLLPSKFEPCGIVQMQAMKYGCIPIARETGGLADTIKEFDPRTQKGDGFLFKEYSSSALLAQIIKAETCFQFKDSWEKLAKRAMKKDFSWEKSAEEYLKLFYNTLKEKKCTG